ncbi:hypothetical protein [Streptomyces sp. NBC_01089]|uniref:hypothetical protein n=1 Tax=Streptomyces sp. NBC_01089 TaxID=2903747 RepID=UPI00386F409F|nr:hypothetical protein OG510_25065 [Streptomyces sp. NBC_01089]
MSGYTYAMFIAVAAIVCALIDGVRLWRLASAGGGADSDKVVVFGVIRVAGCTVLGLVLAVMYWRGADDGRWSGDKVLHETQKIAADIEDGPAPTESPIEEGQPDQGVFTTLVDNETESVVRGSGLALSARSVPPPEGAVDSYVITGTKPGQDGSAEPTKSQACLVFVSAARVPDDLPSGAPDAARVPQYKVSTKVTAGHC